MNSASALLHRPAPQQSATHSRDLFVTCERMSPNEYRQNVTGSGGEGLIMRYGFHPTPFGEALVLITQRGAANLQYMAGLGFVDGGNRADALKDMQTRWPKAVYIHDDDSTAPFIARVFDSALWQPQTPLRVILIGTDFHIRVWETLLKVPFGCTTTYGAIAHQLEKPTASRAVGAAVGRNPISFVVPCHRVLGKSGSLTGYHWGITRKQAMLGWESRND